MNKNFIENKEFKRRVYLVNLIRNKLVFDINFIVVDNQ